MTPIPQANDAVPGEGERIATVIATLWHDLPTLFQQDISYDIYSSDIFFKDPVNTFKGKFNYRIIFWTLRFHARLFFTEIFFDVHDIAQPDRDVILATWTVRGTLRVPWRSKIYFNGSSTYKLNAAQQINQHLDTWDRSPQAILKQFFRPASQPPI